MPKFLELVAQELLQSPHLHQKIVVLPNKRSAIFLKKALLEQADKPLISPQIWSIEDLLVNWSPYQQADWLVLLFEFFKTYKAIYKDKAQSFDEFIRWAPTVLQDFNEIDSFGVNAKEVFTYINEVKKIEDWELKPNEPKMITDYLKFYTSLYDLYAHLQQSLSSKSLTYQGMMSRYVAEHINNIAKQLNDHQLIFAGFNALTTTEKQLIKYLIDNHKAEIFWDADAYYLQKDFEAGKFLRQHQQHFKDFKWLFNDYQQSKQIDIIGVTGEATQTQAIAEILKKYQANQNLEDTAVVLNEDNLLLPLINSLPDTIDSVNITLGLPLNNLSISRFFELLVKLYQEKEQYGRFNLDIIINLINHSHFEQILNQEERQANDLLLQQLSEFKTKLISQELWWQIIQNSEAPIKKLIDEPMTPKKLMKLMLTWIDFLSDKPLNEMDRLALVKLEQVFTYLQDFINQTNEVKNMQTLAFLYGRLLSQERLAFEGEPLEGLQIMGILETRLLDYKNVIISSMNEGVIPQGKNNRSIIPFELKKHFGLPLHHEQNAVMAYHFYRLLQRAEHITLIYNASDSGLGSAEQSRFITQIENELDKNLHTINKKMLGLSTELIPSALETVEKTSVVIKKLEELAQKGLSPSALTMYIRNPLNYYKRYILNLKESVELSDALPANIIGTIIHDAMEALYMNYIGKILNIADFKTIETQIEPLTLQFFIKESFGENAQIDERMITGKNLIIYEIVKKNIKDIVALDKSIVAQGQKLEIIALESHLKAKLPIKNKAVFIRGVVDRIDRLDGRLRITDYKTGKVESRHINLPKKATDLSGLTETETTEKLFQLLTYAWLYYKKGPLLTTDLPLEVGIVSTRQIKQGLLKATVYENELIDVPVIKEFENVLIDLVETMFDPKIPFVDSDSKY